MIAAAVALLSTRWVQYLIGSIAVAAGLWFGVVSPYNNYVSAKKVIKAEAKKDAYYLPIIEDFTKKFKKQTTTFNDLTTQVINDRLNATSAANAAIAQERLNASLKTSKYLSEISVLKAEASQLRADRAAAASGLAERLRYATQPLAAGDSSGQQGVRLSSYTDGLSRLYGQCEKDIGLLIDTAAGALDRLGEAEAAVRALKQ